MSRNSSASSVTRDDHVQDLQCLLEGMTLSGSSLDTITWKRKTTEETITLSQSSQSHSSLGSQPTPVPVLGHRNIPSILSASSSTQGSSVQPALQPSSYIPVIPKPSEILPPCVGLTPDGFWVITVGQEVGIFYHWADVAERTNFVSGNVQKRYPSFQQAHEVYTVKYNEGRVRAVPTPGGPFWHSNPSPASPALSSDSDDLWSQVEDWEESLSDLDI
ncbi:hypothetical protein F4604DRAFT_1926118 [Suillus subluteus]|nr:hypothetical protein F4604DRAFT_1926118 [Suillus subluteus]